MLGLPRRTCHEAAQPVGGRQPQAPTQRVDSDHRTVDSRLLKTAQPRTHLRQVPSLDDYFPLTHVRRGARSRPLPRVLLPSPSLPLSWHPPRINGRRQEGKEFGPNTCPPGDHLSDRPEEDRRGLARSGLTHTRDDPSVGQRRGGLRRDGLAPAAASCPAGLLPLPEAVGVRVEHFQAGAWPAAGSTCRHQRCCVPEGGLGKRRQQLRRGVGPSGYLSRVLAASLVPQPLRP